MILSYYGGVLVSGGGKDIKYALTTWLASNRSIRGVCIDIPRVASGHISFASIEEIKNRMLFSSKYESTMAVLPSHVHVFCFANQPPEWTSLSADRWKVFEIKDGVMVGS